MKNLRPRHTFLGFAVYILGLATMATGLQEKATFLQAFEHPSVRAAAMVCPALIGALLAVTGALYLYHHAPPVHLTDCVEEPDSSYDCLA